MKFQGSSQLPPHQDRCLQLRMLGFVGLIALLLFGWKAWRISNGTQGTSHPHYQPTPSLGQVDFSVEEEPTTPLKDDEFRISRRRLRDAEDETPADDGEGAEFAERTAQSLLIPRAWLTEVEDNTVGIRQDEADAFYRILAKAQAASLKELQAQAKTEALFVNLMTSPERYRGRPVTIVGELRKLFDIPVPRNKHGVTKLYEAWICTAESGENPYRVVCSAIPPELKPRESSRVDVKVTGYFFKREGYQTQDHRLHVAPTLLAGRISLYVAPQSPPPVEDVVPWMVGVISVVGLAMLATVVGYAIGDSRGRRGLRITQHTSQLTPLDMDRLSRADRRLSVEESLRRLAAGEKFDDADDDSSWSGNGHSDQSGNGYAEETELSEELIDLPTPFPPTRVPRRWDHPN